MNNIHKHVEFELTEEGIKNNYLGLFIHTGNNNLQPGIYRKPTGRHYCPLHIQPPLEHKFAAYNFYINRVLFTPITEQARQQEWDSYLYHS
jgi:hypothetical protein